MASMVAQPVSAPTLSGMPKGSDLPEALSAVASPEVTAALPGCAPRVEALFHTFDTALHIFFVSAHLHGPTPG